MTYKAAPPHDSVDHEWLQAKIKSSICPPSGLNEPPPPSFGSDQVQGLGKDSLIEQLRWHPPAALTAESFYAPPGPPVQVGQQPAAPAPSQATDQRAKYHPNPNGRALLQMIHAMSGNKGARTSNVKELVTQEVKILRNMDVKQPAKQDPAGAFVREMDAYNKQNPAPGLKTREAISERQTEIEDNIALHPQIAAKQKAIDAKNMGKPGTEPAPTPQPTVWKANEKTQNPTTIQPPSTVRLEMQVHETELEECIVQYDAIKRLGDNYDTWSLEELKSISDALEVARIGITQIYKKMDKLMLNAKNRELGWFDDLVVPDDIMDLVAEVVERNFGGIVDFNPEFGMGKVRSGV